MNAQTQTHQAQDVTTPRRLRSGDYHTTIKVNCGCGFRASTISEGEAHVRKTGHTLHLLGEISRA